MAIDAEFFAVESLEQTSDEVDDASLLTSVDLSGELWAQALEATSDKARDISVYMMLTLIRTAVPNADNAKTNSGEYLTNPVGITRSITQLMTAELGP